MRCLSDRQLFWMGWLLAAMALLFLLSAFYLSSKAHRQSLSDRVLQQEGTAPVTSPLADPRLLTTVHPSEC